MRVFRGSLLVVFGHALSRWLGLGPCSDVGVSGTGCCVGRGRTPFTKAEITQCNASETAPATPSFEAGLSGATDSAPVSAQRLQKGYGLQVHRLSRAHLRCLGLFLL